MTLDYYILHHDIRNPQTDPQKKETPLDPLKTIQVIPSRKKPKLVGGFSPTHLKNLQPSNWIMKPQGSGWKFNKKQMHHNHHK